MVVLLPKAKSKPWLVRRSKQQLQGPIRPVSSTSSATSSAPVAERSIVPFVPIQVKDEPTEADPESSDIDEDVPMNRRVMKILRCGVLKTNRLPNYKKMAKTK
jgi:hypothetical protein